VTLARNPRFRSWSSAAVPDGYPDAITVTGSVDPRVAVPDVETARADYLAGPPTREQVRRLQTSDPGRLHTAVNQATEFFFLNTRVPPFDDVLVRKAINFAVDRRAAVELEGGEGLAQPTCQILPPNFPGYRPTCPYTIDPGPGRSWHAPDVARARRLVARSRTAGMRVKVWVPGRQFAPAARLVVRALRDLGYDAGLRILAPEDYIPYVSDPRRRAQVSVQKWGPDYPAASNFLRVLFGCPQPGVGSGTSWNWSRFCDRTAERLATRATRLQASDPVAADALWARVDRRVVDAAAAVPLLNPKRIDFVSKRVGNYQHSPQWGVLLDQLWVR
jgi:peptide/nickel transport system substrate-binding protein